MELLLSNNVNKRMVHPVKKMVLQYKLIEAGDRVAVGLSGGKDSTTLLYLLRMLQKQLPFSFDIVPISLSLGFEETDISPMQQFTDALDLPLHLVDTSIGKILFDIRKEKNPCSLCANLRRGTLYDHAKKLGCSKVALGHHLDDAVETFFMNFFFNGKLATFRPKTYLDRQDITIIRPMISLEEEQIIRFITSKKIPIVHNPCPADKQTKREEIKELVADLSKRYPNLRKQFFNGAQTIDEMDFWKPDLYVEGEDEEMRNSRNERTTS